MPVFGTGSELDQKISLSRAQRPQFAQRPTATDRMKSNHFPTWCAVFFRNRTGIGSPTWSVSAISEKARLQYLCTMDFCALHAQLVRSVSSRTRLGGGDKTLSAFTQNRMRRSRCIYRFPNGAEYLTQAEGQR